MKLFASIQPETPVVPFHSQTCLDLGCGDHSIFSDNPQIADECFAADVRPAKAYVPTVACKAEQLPFADGSFDLVVSRVSLPYMHIPRALREVHRVLSPGGCLWATLHRRNVAYARMVRSMANRDIVDVLYQSVALANGALLYFTDRQISWRGVVESVQIPAAIRKALNRAGFVDIETEIVKRGTVYFAVRAFRPASLQPPGAVGKL
jgi:ubiquinone/menaquinone biosynthesis C-methylase UbiE